MRQEPQKKHTPAMPAHGKTPKFPSVPMNKVSVNVPMGGYTGANTGNRTTGNY